MLMMLAGAVVNPACTAPSSCAPAVRLIAARYGSFFHHEGTKAQ
jgi:hypothetical protein